MQNATQAIYSYAQWVLTLFTSRAKTIRSASHTLLSNKAGYKSASCTQYRSASLPQGDLQETCQQACITSVVRRFAQFDSSVGYEMVRIKI